MIRIPLRDEKVALIDDEDADAVLRHKWHLHISDKKFCYASTNIRLPDEATRKYRLIKLHRFILRPEPLQIVDHINGDGLDCRRSNLRLCTSRQNALNARPYAGTSQYKGVSWQTSRGRWIAAIKISGRDVTLGRFKSETDAARAYSKAAEQHFGEFAWLNNLPD